MYDLVSYITNKGQSGTIDPSSSPGVIARTIDYDTVWIEYSVDLETPPNPDYIRGWFFTDETLPGYSFFPNSSAIETGDNPPDKKLYTSNILVRLYLDEDTIIDPQGNRVLDFRLSTAVAHSETALKNGEWIESTTADIIFTIYANGNPAQVFLDVLPVDEFESDFGSPTNSLTIDSAYINGMRVDSAHIRHLAYVNLIEGDSAQFEHITTNTLAANTLITDLEINGQKIYGEGSALSGNTLDLDYDEPTDRSNSVALTSLQSIHNFLDVNNNETGNYWALYNNLNAYTDTINKNNAIFSIDETGAVVAKSLEVNQYILDSGGLKWSKDSNVKIYYDSNAQAWRIEPDLFGYADSVTPGSDSDLSLSSNNLLLNLSGRDGQFLSYGEASEAYYLDYALKTGRFIFDDDQLNEEKEFIPDTQLESMDSQGKYKYYDQFSRFSHYNIREFDSDPIEDFTFPFNDSDTQVLIYDETTNSINSNFAPRTFAGFISPKRYNSYDVKATFSSTTATDFPVFLVVAQLNIRGREYTISAFRRPKGTLQEYSDYLETGYLAVKPPSWGLVYNYGQTDEYYLDFDWVTRGAAPAPVTPTFDGQSTSDWVSAGQTTIFAQKKGNVISVATNQFGSTDIENFEFRTGIEIDIEQAIAGGKTFLEPFLNAETSYGFGTQEQSGVIISDIIFRTEDNDKNIFDLKNDLIYTFVSDREKDDFGVETPGYYVFDSNIGVDQIMNTGRLFYNERSKTLYWKDPDNSYQLIKEVDLSGLPQSSAYVEMRGTGLNNNSPAYLYIDNETEYFEFDENPILLKGYHGHGRGLNLTTFDSNGTKLSSNTFDTHVSDSGSILLSDAINNMSNGHIGAITSSDAWVANVNDTLRTTAFDQGLMKLYNAPTTPIRNPYSAVFQKTGAGGTVKAHEISSDDSSISPYADLTFSITRGTFHTYGPEQPNSLSAWNGKREAWIDENHNTKINNTLMLTEGRYKGLAFDGTSFTVSGINEDSARIYLVSEEDSQRTMVLKVGDNLNDKIAFEVPDNDGVLQNGFINFHRGNLHIVYDQTPQLGGDLDVQQFRMYKDSLENELIDLGYTLGKGSNSIATASRQSIFNFLDRNNNETDNFFGIFSNKNPITEATTIDDAVFSVEEDGTVNMNLESNGAFNFNHPGGTPITEVGEGTGRQVGLTTDDIPEGPSGLNLYFDSARVFLALKETNSNNNSVYNASGGGIGKITVNQTNKTLDFEGITNTDGLPEGNTNLYFTDERAQDAVGNIMSGDDDIAVTYTDNGAAAGTIEITSTLTQEKVFGLQTKYELQGGGTASNDGQIKLNIDSNGISRTETITVTGANGINIDGSGTNLLVVDAGSLIKTYSVSSGDVTGGSKLILTETDINNNTTDDQVSFLGVDGVSISQASDEITISAAGLQAVSKITADSSSGNIFINLNDSSPTTGVSTITQLGLTASNGLGLSVTNAGAANSSINISAAQLQITSTLQANASAPGVDTRIGFSETDANGNTDSQFIKFVGSGGITVSSIAPAGAHDGIITISADSMNRPNTTYIAEFADPPGVTVNEVDFKLIHQGPDSGEDTTLKIKSNDGILITESNGELHIGSIVQIEQINNETITFETNATDAAISLGTTKSFTVNSSTSETIQINHGATGSGSPTTGTNSGQTVVQNINLDKFGHVQSITNGTVAGQYLMSATDNNQAVIRLDTQANGLSGSAEDVIIEGSGQTTVTAGVGGTKIIISTPSVVGAFNNLTDVDTTGTSNSNVGHDVTNGSVNHIGHVPMWDGTDFTTRKINFVNHDIADVDIDGVSFEEVLAWIGPNYPAAGGVAAWRNASLSDLLDIPSSIDDLSDVDITTTAPTNDQALVWDGTNFVPGDVAADLAMNDLTDVSTSGISDGQAIIYQASTSSFIAGDAGEVYTASDGIDLSGTAFSVAAGNGLTQTTTGLKMSGSYTGDFTLTGAFTATGDITAFGTSDKRLKSNISVIDNALDKINKISGYTFNWNELAENKDQTLREAGVLAQEVEEVLPEVTTTREDGYKAVRYEKLVPLLIEAIKELSEKVERLEREK
jgi:hypothetical protein